MVLEQAGNDLHVPTSTLTPAAARAPEVAALRRHLAGLDLVGLDDPVRAGSVVRRLVAGGRLALPLPGQGRTRDRLALLAALGEADLVLGRLGEGHADAVAILAELEPAAVAGADDLWGVWAADPPDARLTAEPDGRGRWTLDGAKGWCSGAGSCTRALVTAHAPDGYRLFAVSVGGAGVAPVDGSWPALGMAGSDTRRVTFERVMADPVGGPGDYLGRAGFWWGAVGVAAVWHGGARGVGAALQRAAARRPLDPHALAHAGAVDAELWAAAAVLDAAADAVDGAGNDSGALLAARTRAAVERVATEVVDRVGRALGAAPLGLDRAHARRVADLTVYLRQSHAERDLAELGRLSLAAAQR